MKKKWKFGLKVADSHSEPGNLQKRGNFHFFNHVFIIFFIFLARGTWNPGKPWKLMENHQKQRKMKKNEVANEKKWKFGLKVADSHSEPGNLQKLGEIFIFLIIFLLFIFHFFIIFLARGTWNSGKPWKSMKNNGKQSKTKEHEKKWNCKWKKMKIWTQSCRFSLWTRKSSKTRGNFHFFNHCFIIFLKSFFYHSPCPWHRKSKKTININEKQWKTIKNKGTWKKMKLQMKKKWKFGLKVADSHSEPGNLQKLEEIFIF